MKNDPRLKAHARQLRKELTPAERILWKTLRDRRFAGFKFRRQQILGQYVLDFYCSNALIAIEVDGETHLGNEMVDAQRQQWIEEQGVKVLRFWNNQIYDEFDAVIELIFRECDARRDLRMSRSLAKEKIEDQS